MPDRPFHNFRASIFSIKMSIDIFRGSRIAKESIGSEASYSRSTLVVKPPILCLTSNCQFPRNSSITTSVQSRKAANPALLATNESAGNSEKAALTLRGSAGGVNGWKIEEEEMGRVRQRRRPPATKILFYFVSYFFPVGAEGLSRSVCFADTWVGNWADT